MISHLRSGWQCTAVTQQNEERLDQRVCSNQWITTRGLHTEMNVGFSALKTMASTAEYSKVCTQWVPRTHTQEQKQHSMQLLQDLLNQHKAEGDSSLDCIFTSDKMWCHCYEMESKQQSMGWWREFHIEENVQDAALSEQGNVPF